MMEAIYIPVVPAVQLVVPEAPSYIYTYLDITVRQGT